MICYAASSFSGISLQRSFPKKVKSTMINVKVSAAVTIVTPPTQDIKEYGFHFYLFACVC